MNNKTICPMRFAPALMTLTLALLTARPALAQHQLWIRQFGTNGIDIAYAIAPDGIGGVMVAGYTTGSLGGPNAGDDDAFLARYDDTGNQLWVTQIGSGGGEAARALAPDGAGGVFVAGYTWFNLGGPNAGSTDAFLARYDGTGNRLWIRQFGTRSAEWATALASDGTGGVIVAGFTRGSLGGPNAGSSDTFLARYDNAGNQLWIKQFGTSEDELAWALTPDGAGGVMVAGFERRRVSRSIIFESFLARFDENGDELWTAQISASESVEVIALAPDGAGGVIVAGTVTPISGGHQAFVARYDENGGELWRTLFGSGAHANALVSDGAGGVVVAGLVHGDLGGPNAGYDDAWIARFDAAGSRLWLRQFGTSGGESAFALAPDGAAGVIVAGYTTGSLGGPNAGGVDAFLARYEIDSCYPDCDRSTGNGVLDIIDYLCFQNSFVTGDPFACDCDTSTGPGVCDMSDFLCFQKAFMAGCP